MEHKYIADGEHYGEQLKGAWTSFIGTRFLSSDNLENGQEIALTIKKVTKELAFSRQTNQQKELISIHFYETKKIMACNKENAKNIENITNQKRLEKWVDHKITIFKAFTNFGGKKVSCLRIKAPNAQQPQNKAEN